MEKFIRVRWVFVINRNIMMNKRIINTAAILSLFFSLSALAEVDKKILRAISHQFEEYEIYVDEVRATPVPNIYEVQTSSGILYSNQDGSYFFFGAQLLHSDNKKITNLTEISLAKRNFALFKKANIEKELIVYPAKNEKYVVNVFTDTTCGYCVKLHNDMKKYNDLGITIRYIAFPRGGERAKNFPQMSAIWCAKDKNQALDLAKEQKYTQTSKNCSDLVRSHMNLGQKMGITGTPAIMLADGSMINGYIPPKDLLNRLREKS